MNEKTSCSRPVKIAMIGTGYVGLVSGVCFANLGHKVTCVDKDPSKIEGLKAGQVHIYEPGLEEMIALARQEENIKFTVNLAEAVAEAEAVFIAVGTPMGKDGGADLGFVEAAAREIARHAQHGVVVVTKSTVPVGTNLKVERWISEENPDLEFEVASNPEFLREGAAISDFMMPDRIVVGCKGVRARDVMSDVYAPLSERGIRTIFTNLASAEMTKYAANAFLAMKVGFINQVADLCEATGADISDVSKGIGTDTRIGGKFLMPGPGYGGSCFPKDTNALVKIGKDMGSPMSIIEKVVDANDARKKSIAGKILSLVGEGAKIGVLGVTFKANTDDMRESPALDIIPQLLKSGAEVVAYDPQGRTAAEPLLPGVKWAESAYGAARGTDILVVLTEWSEFKAMDLGVCAGIMRRPVIFDTRSIFVDMTPTEFGFLEYHCIGKETAISRRS